MRLSPAQRRWSFAVARSMVARRRQLCAERNYEPFFHDMDVNAFSGVLINRYHAAAPERQELLYDLILEEVRPLTGYTDSFKPFRRSPEEAPVIAP